MNTCTDCWATKDTAWRMTDEGGKATAIRCCDTCTAIRINRGETLQLLPAGFEKAMRANVAALSS